MGIRMNFKIKTLLIWFVIVILIYTIQLAFPLPLKYYIIECILGGMCGAGCLFGITKTQSSKEEKN